MTNGTNGAAGVRMPSYKINLTPKAAIYWNKDKLAQFKRAHHACVANGQESFEFEGHPLLAAYAKYLIEFLEGKLPK